MDRYRRRVWLVMVVALSLLLPACAAPRTQDATGVWSYVKTRLDAFWWFANAEVSGANLKAKGTGRTIAIVDTGVLPGHEDIAMILSGVATCGSDPTHTKDYNGHGTQLAGIALGKNPGHTYEGLPTTQGVAPAAGLIPIKVSCGVVSVDSLVRGVQEAINRKADVVLIALGGYPTNPPDVHSRLEELVKAEPARNILFVVASVWDGSAYPFPPWTKLGNVIVVAAMTLVEGEMPPRNEVPFNDKLGDIWAPGRDVNTADIVEVKPGEHAGFLMPGTSAAAAIVAGCAALVKEVQPGSNGADLKQALVGKAETKPNLPLSKRLNCNAAVQ